MDETCNLPIDRALNALSYSFNANNYENLFYTLLGIEALYNTDRSDGMMEQIRTKTVCLLGEPEKFKKRISNMYSIRSSFVHGSLNFPSKFNIYDAKEEFEKFMYKDYMPTVITAQSILLATLRELIRHNASEMVFSTIVALK